MQPRALLIAVPAAMIAILAVAGAAGAQSPPKKRPPTTPRPAAELALPASKKTAPPPATPPLRLGGPVGATTVGDPAPACRAQCSKDRYVCHAAGDPADCDSRWIPCLRACSAR